MFNIDLMELFTRHHKIKLILKRKIQLVFSHYGAKLKVDSELFRQLQQRKQDNPTNPPVLNAIIAI